MAYRTTYIDLDLRGISEIINNKVSDKAVNFVKDLRNLSIVEEGAFESAKFTRNKEPFMMDEKVRQVFSVDLGDDIHNTAILTDKTLHITNLQPQPQSRPLIPENPVKVWNVDYKLDLLKDYPQGIVSVSLGDLRPALTHALVLTYDKKLLHLRIKFTRSDVDNPFQDPEITETYIKNIPAHSPISCVENIFYYFEGDKFFKYDPETSLPPKELLTLSFTPESFLVTDSAPSSDNIEFHFKSKAGSVYQLNYNKLTNAYNLQLSNEDIVFPFEKDEYNGYTMLNCVFDNDYGYLIRFLPGSGYFLHAEKVGDGDFGDLNNNVQAKFLSDIVLPDKPTVIPYCDASDYPRNFLPRNNLIGDGRYVIFPMVLPTSLVNPEGKIPQPGQLSLITFFETKNKLKGFRFGNQSLITGSFLRQIEKGRLIEFGFNALPELNKVSRSALPDTNLATDTPDSKGTSLTEITAIDDSNFYRDYRKRTIVNADSVIDSDYTQLDENRSDIYELPSLDFISTSAIINRVYKAVYAWTDGNGITHRSEPSLAKTYNPDPDETDHKTEKFYYLDQTFRHFYTRNQDGTYSENPSRQKELRAQRWDYHYRQPKEVVSVSEKLYFTRKNDVRIEIYSTNPDTEDSQNFFLIKALDNDLVSLPDIEFAETDYSVSCEVIVTNKELNTYNTDRFTPEESPEESINFGRLLLREETSLQPSGTYSIIEHDNRTYLAYPNKLEVSEPNTQLATKPNLIFKNSVVPVADRIIDIQSQDDNIVIFSAKKIHIYNENFEGLRSVRSPNFDIQDDNRHLIAMNAGIIFKDKYKGLFLFSTGNQFPYIGAEVDKQKNQKILDVFEHPTNKEIHFLAEDKILIFNWFFGNWTYNEDIEAVSAAVTNENIFYNEKLGDIIETVPNEYKEETIIESHYLSFTPEPRKKRIIGIRVTGEFENLSSIVGEFAINGEDDYRALTVSPLTPLSTSSPTNSQRKTFDLLSSIQKCNSMKFKVRFLTDGRKKIKINKVSLKVKLLTNEYNIADALKLG